jgi:hypothetical protein
VAVLAVSKQVAVGRSRCGAGSPTGIDGGEAPGVTIEENEENRRLREEAILKAARTFFGELDLCNG